MNVAKHHFKRTALAFFLFFASVQTIAQNSIAPTTDALGLARDAHIPVDYYTGRLNISIPFGQVEGRELSVPISITYNTKGHRVNDIAGAAGLGWSLNAGGLITRIVRGGPDDLANGFCKPSPTDSEPDIFFYNFLGQTGKFVLDKNGNAITIPFRNIVIVPGICKTAATGEWQIIDENGRSYKFGTSSSHRETTTSTPLSGAATTYTSSWFLSEVTSPNNTDKIQFNYYNSATITSKNFYFEKVSCESTPRDKSTTITAQTRYISSITSTTGGSASFSWSYNRRDGGGLSLNGIYLYNRLNEQISKYKLEYSYFQSDGCSTSECFRLRLDKIYDLAPDPLYQFTYNTSINLPSRFSKSIDHWGHYNNNTVDSWIPRVLPTDNQYLIPRLGSGTYPPRISYSIGAIRDPDPTRCVANSITRMDNRGGGFQTFEFTHDGAGGLSIKKIVMTDGQGNELTRNFVYSGGGIGIPSTYAIVGDGASFIFSHALMDFWGFSSLAGYTQVDEFNQNNEKLVYKYYPARTMNYDDNGKIRWYNLDWMSGKLNSVSVYDNAGRILKQDLYEYNFNITPNKGTVKGDNWVGSRACGFGFAYPFYYTEVSRAMILTKHTNEIYEPANSLNKSVTITDYQYEPSTFLLAKTFTYDASRSSQKYLTAIRYPIHSDYDFCTQQYQDCMATCDPITGQVCMDNCDSQRYNCETNGAGTGSIAAILKLKKRNQVATPIETTKLYTDGISTKVLSSSVNVFNLEGTGFSQVNLKEVWAMNQVVDESAFTYSKTLGSGAFQFDTRMRKLQTNNSYDATTGNLLQQTSLSGIQTNYTWDANNMPISQTVSGGVNSRTTNTNYKLMVGPTTATDANGVVSKKEYDVFNRVSVIKDFQDNILARYRYHYKNEKPNFSIAPQITETLVNTNLSFYVIDIASSIGGTPTFLWDFGDGTTITNGSTSVSHTYTNTGTYTLKLVGMNPEYGATTRTLQIGVFNPLSVSVCADGPVYVDLCGTNPPAYGSCTSVQDPNGSTQLTATISGGCASSYQYYWEYRNAASTVWTFLGSAQTVNFSAFSSVEASFEIRCTVTDGCYNQSAASENVTYYKSNPSCPGNIR